jgi:hypothetical protein
VLKEHKKFEINEFVKTTDGVTAKWVNDLPDLQTDLEAFVAVKFQVTWQKYSILLLFSRLAHHCFRYAFKPHCLEIEVSFLLTVIQ